MSVTLEFTPRLLPSPQAAHYLGVSESTLRGLSLPRRQLGGKRLYDRYDLDAFASSLPVASNEEKNTCDDILREIECG